MRVSGLFGWRAALVAGASLTAVAIGGMSRGQTEASAAPPAGSWPASAPARAVIATPPSSASPVERGRYLATLGDCAACHTAPGGRPFAGGLALNTPFGVIYSTNITPDKDTGIGGWTAEQFRRALQEGKDDQGQNLYPAMPYPYFSHVSAADIEAIRAYLMTVPAVHQEAPANRLPFPLNIRFLVKGWNWLNFRPGAFQTVPGQSAVWNRGAYIVTTLGHCGACHTPKNALGGDTREKPLQGGELDNWYATNLNGDAHSGLGDWSEDDIALYLRGGANGHAEVSASMREVVEVSTSKMSDADLHTVAVYLKSLPETPEPTIAPPDPKIMRAGHAIYLDQCSACHAPDGSGVKGLFPPLRGNPGVQQARPTTGVHAILAGAQAAATPSKPSQPAMPAFAWKLTNDEVAAVSTYVGNSWGNRAKPVSPADVGKLRAHVAAHPVERKRGAV